MEYQRAVPLVLAGDAAAGQSTIRGMRGEFAVDVPDQKAATAESRQSSLQHEAFVSLINTQ